MVTTGIPTRYGGVQFRSRLEARWAAFFDLVGWRWDYEPIDLDGYIPDFVVTAPLWESHLIEVKSLVELGDSRFGDAAEKIRRSGWSGAWCVVGAALHRTQDHGAGPALLVGTGYVAEHESYFKIGRDDGDWRLEPEFCNSIGADACGRAIAYWREAGNRVQWRAPEARR